MHDLELVLYHLSSFLMQVKVIQLAKIFICTNYYGHNIVNSVIIFRLSLRLVRFCLYLPYIVKNNTLVIQSSIFVWVGGGRFAFQVGVVENEYNNNNNCCNCSKSYN